MKSDVETLIPASSLIEIDQLSHVQSAAYSAVNARKKFQRATTDLAENERLAIDISGDRRPYVMIPGLTILADALFGYSLFVGSIAGVQVWLASLIAAVLALFVSITAVTLELFAAHLYRTKRSRIVRVVCCLFGLMVPAGLVWVLLILKSSLAVNTGGRAFGADVKLLVFGGVAAALHVVLFMAGGRVLHGWRQFRNQQRIARTCKLQKQARAAWYESCSQVIQLDNRLEYSVAAYNAKHPNEPIGKPSHDVVTAALLDEIKAGKGVPNINPELSKPRTASASRSATDTESPEPPAPELDVQPIQSARAGFSRNGQNAGQRG